MANADQTFPISRPVEVERLPQHGADISVTPSQEDLAALAQMLDLPAIQALTGDFHVTGDRRRARVTGQVTARVTQICGVTLEPFEAQVSEEVDLDFAAEDRRARSPEEEEQRAIDPPDEIINGRIDLGRVTAEFLALGLDPFPRKPDAVFEEPAPAEPERSPFAALAGLRKQNEGE
jgi:uncharacterized metal-binding protein YceD (DUF177 family)